MSNDGRQRKLLYTALSGAAAVAVSAAAVSLLLSVYSVTGDSMEPSLHDGELVICVKCLRPKKNSIMLLRYDGRVLIKRVIGLAGDEVCIGSRGSVYVNGKLLDGHFIKTDCRPLRCIVPKGRLFLLGDNLAVSFDSRSPFIGCVSDKAVIGRALACVSGEEVRRLS